MLLRQGAHGGCLRGGLRNPQDAVAEISLPVLIAGASSLPGSCPMRPPVPQEQEPAHRWDPSAIPMSPHASCPDPGCFPAALTYPPASPLPAPAPSLEKQHQLPRIFCQLQLPSCLSPGTASCGLGLHSRSPSSPPTPSWPCSQLASTPPPHIPGPHSCPSPALGQGHFLSARDLSSQDCKRWPSSHRQSAQRQSSLRGSGKAGRQKNGA